jgi:hypothetical protein
MVFMLPYHAKPIPQGLGRFVYSLFIICQCGPTGIAALDAAVDYRHLDYIGPNVLEMNTDRNA